MAVHDSDDAVKVCPCGYDLKKIRKEVSEQLDIIPAKVQVVRHIRPKYAYRGLMELKMADPLLK